MSKYNIDLDYAVVGVDISKEELQLIIEEADKIIIKKNIDKLVIIEAILKKVQCMQKLGKIIETKELIKKLLKLSPDMPEALVRMANVYDKEKKNSQALKYINNGLNINKNYAYGQYILGIIHEESNKYKNAILHYRKAIRYKKDYIQAYKNCVICYSKIQDYDHMKEYCDKIISMFPHDAEIFGLRGDANALLQKYDEAIADYTESIKFKVEKGFDIAIYHERGNVYTLIKKYDEAITDFSKIIDLQENDIEAYLSRGRAYFAIRNYDKAINDFFKVIGFDENNSEAYFYRGGTYFALKDYENAIHDYSKVIELKSNQPGAYYYRGRIYLIKKEYDKAINDLTKAIEFGEHESISFYYRGQAYNEKEDYDKAIKDFTRVIELDDKDIYAYYFRGQAYHGKEDYDKAIEDFLKGINLDDKNYNGYFYRGKVYFAKGEYDKAIEDFSKVIELNDKSTSGYFYRGQAYDEKGEYDKAIEDFSKIIELDDKDHYSYFYRGQAYNEKEEYDKAIVDFSKVIELNDKSTSGYFYRGKAYDEKGEYDKAIEDFSKVIELNDKNPSGYFYRGQAYDEKKEYDKAIEDFSKVIELDDKNHIGYFYRGKVYSAKGEYDKAIIDFSSAINIDPQACYHCKLGSAYHNKGNYDKALKEYLNTINKNTDNCPDIFKIRADTFFRKKEYDKAINDLTTAIDINENSCLYCERSNVYYEKNDTSKAFEDIKIAIKLKPKCGNEIYSKRGYFYLELEEYSKAIKDFSKAQIKNPHEPRYYYLRGCALIKQKKYDTALEDFNKAIELSKNNIPIQYYFYRSVIYYNLKDLKKSLLDIFEATNLDPHNTDCRKNFISIVDDIFNSNIDLFFDLDVDLLYKMPHFFIKTIASFKEKEMCADEYKQLIKSIYSVWSESYPDLDDKFLYQYTSQAVLENIINNQRLRLTPVDYLNDPLEGEVLFTQLNKYFINNINIKNILGEVKNKNLNSIAFVRSFTLLENKISMWNSSYAENGNGVAIGIKIKKLNKGFVLKNQNNILLQKNEFDSCIPDTSCNEIQKNENLINNKNGNINNFMSINNMGLYKIIYIDNDRNNKSNEMIKNIAECLIKIPENDLSEDSFISLLSELLLSIAHIIKDKAYEHEEEYRLMYIGSVLNDQDCIHSSIHEGIYIETENFLFKDNEEKDILYFGPNMDLIKKKKIEHYLKHKNLYAELKHSNVPYRK